MMPSVFLFSRKTAGQAMVESVIVVLLLCFVFFSLVEYARIATAKIICEHAAARVARAETVGLNRFMRMKVARLATIPIAGVCETSKDMPLSIGAEQARMPLYLAADTAGKAEAILHYQQWPTVKISSSGSGGGSFASDSKVTVSSELPLVFLTPESCCGCSFGQTSVTCTGNYTIENHYPLYLEDENR